MKQMLCLLGLMLGVGCTTPVVRPYVGEQQNWPIARDGIVSTGFDLPVFVSLPPRPYDIVAAMRTKNSGNARLGKGDLPVLVKKAKAMGAEAIIFVDPRSFFAVNYGARPASGGQPATVPTAGQFNPDSFPPGTTVLAIKWVATPTPSEPPTPAPPPSPEPPPDPAPAPAPANP